MYNRNTHQDFPSQICSPPEVRLNVWDRPGGVFILKQATFEDFCISTYARFVRFTLLAFLFFFRSFVTFQQVNMAATTELSS